MTFTSPSFRERLVSSSVLVAYPVWWMLPLFVRRPPERLGTRLADTVAMEMTADGFQRGWSSFLHYGSDFFPNGQTFVRLDWLSQLLPHVYTWTASHFLSPADVLHGWILFGWMISGFSVYWSMRVFSAGCTAATVAALVVQMMPAFRWFAVNHVNYMFIASAIVPATWIVRSLTSTESTNRARGMVLALGVHFLLLLLDGYIGYFAVLLSIAAIGVASASSTNSTRMRLVFVAVSLTLLSILLLAGRLFALTNRSNADRTLRGYISVTQSDLRTLVDTRLDLGFGNLTPFVGWPVVLLLVVGVASLRNHRALFITGVLVAVATAFSISSTYATWGFPSDVLGKFVPRLRYYDRYAVLIAIIIVAAAFGTTLGRLTKQYRVSMISVFGFAAAIVTVILFQPQLLRGETDSSVAVGELTASLTPEKHILLRIGGPPPFVGARFASFPTNWDERYALSQGSEHLRDIACETGISHVLVNGAFDSRWQGVQDLSAYGPREWVNFDDERYFIPRAAGWWDDRSDATTFNRIPLQLYELNGCVAPKHPVDSLAAPIEVVNDGVLIRQIRQDEFNNLNFAVSPKIIIEPRFKIEYRDATLSWRFTVGVAEGFTLPGLTLDVTASGSSRIRNIALQGGQSRLVTINTNFPHQLVIATQPKSSVNYYFSIANFNVRQLGPVNQEISG
jgi:hypothetical protein